MPLRGFPPWVTTTAQGPIVSVALLLAAAPFGLTVNPDVAVPLPLVTAGTSQVWLDTIVHAQPASVNTLTLPVPPAAGTLADVGDTL